MSYFLTTQQLNIGSEVFIDGDEARHILLARRMKPGEKFELQDSLFHRFEAEVVKTHKDSLEVQILRAVDVPAEPSVVVTMYISYVQEKALDFILQKATELGTARVVIFNSNRTATKLSQDQFSRKHDRWTKILWESAKQCGRSKIPELIFLASLDGVILDNRYRDKIFLCDASGYKVKDLTSAKATSNKQPTLVKSLGIIIGPEGGLDLLEIEKIKSQLPNLELIKLSPFTLRAETAAIAGLAVVQNLSH